MDQSPFSRLPAELREEIYRIALHVDGKLEIYPVMSVGRGRRWLVQLLHHGADRRHLPHNLAALTSTCRQIRAEVWRVLHSTNEWTVELSHSVEFLQWLSRTEAPEQALIRHIDVHVDMNDIRENLNMHADAKEFYSAYQAFVRRLDKDGRKTGMLITGVQLPDSSQGHVRTMLEARASTDFCTSGVESLRGDAEDFIAHGTQLFEQAAPGSGNSHMSWQQ